MNFGLPNFLKKKNLVNAKTATMTLTILVLVMISVQPSYAVTISPSLGAGSQVVGFRDINVLTGFTPTLTINPARHLIGQSVTITVNDPNANVDLTANETVKINDGPSSVPLTESASNTGIFSNPAVLQGALSYTQLPPRLLRADIDTDVATGGTVSFSDVIFPTGSCITGGGSFVSWTQVSHAVDIEPGTGTINKINSITFSYANIPEAAGAGASGLVIAYRPDSSSSFALVSLSANDGGAGVGGLTVNAGANTVSVDNALLSLAQASDPGDVYTATATLQPGQYMLGMENIGCLGGGTSGIVSSGFVLNFLAGIGRAENTVTPPSFGGGMAHYSDGLAFTQGTTKTTLDTSKYNQELPKQVMTKGVPADMTFKTFENYNPTAMVHMGLYIIPRGQDMVTTNSIGSIVWEKGKPVEVNDPNNILSGASVSSTDDGKFQYTKFSFTPEKSYDKMSFLVRAWNDHKYSADIRVHDDVITPPVIKTLPTGVVQYDNFDNLQAAIENDKFHKPLILAHIHGTTDVFRSTDSGHLYWLYDTINHSVTLVIEDKNGNELYSYKETLDPIVQDKKADYGFMQFTVQQLNRANEQQEKQAMKLEEEKAMAIALEKGLTRHYNW
ncbi:Uncharacterised protein [uncultured archaeon]|nr:Uncharacterised protein [uncultured archaeon]